MTYVAEAAKKPESITKLKLKITVEPTALPGVREFRLATPHGASTVGMLVVVRDPVIAEKAGRFYPQDLRGRYEVNQWVIWQMANQGPKSGECGHFLRVPESAGDQSYAKRRFGDEVNRLFGVMNNRLYDRRYLAGDEYTIADMISYPWTVNWKGQGQEIDEFPYFKRWFEELGRRPGVQRGMAAG